MAARGLEHRERAIDIGAKIGFRLLNRRNDVSARRKMENSFRARTRRIDGTHIGNIGLDDLKARIAVVLLQIAAPADNEIVEDANMAALVDQPIDKMASDEARTPCDQIKHRPREFIASRQPLYRGRAANNRATYSGKWSGCKAAKFQREMNVMRLFNGIPG